MINRYAGQCVYCFRHVARGEGFYNGGVECEEVVRGGDRPAEEVAEITAELAAKGYAPEVIERAIWGRSQMWVCFPAWRREVFAEAKALAAAAAYEASPEAVAARAERDARLNERAAREDARDAEWARQGLKRCKRCGGAGGSDSWPGWACYDCNGVGALPHHH